MLITFLRKKGQKIESTMRAKAHKSLNPKLLLLGVLIAFILIFLLRSSLSSSHSSLEKRNTNSSPRQKTLVDDNDNLLEHSSPNKLSENEKIFPQACTKISPSLAKTVIHYATSSITPQQTLNEISVSARVLEKRSPCNFLVFGLGHDSLMWATLNQRGRTLFLEEDKAWIEQIRLSFPSLESRHVEYHTKVRHAGSLMEIGRGPNCMGSSDPMQPSCPLFLKDMPDAVRETEWDVIMVDAPTGYYEDAPGRMAAIYTAGMMARRAARGREADLFVHDVNRVVEDEFSEAFLCEGYMREQEGRLRHFKIPSHLSQDGTSFERPFCPGLN